MRLLIKQRVFSWGDTYDIYDEGGAVRFFVKAEVFSFGHQIHVYDAFNNEVGFISQQIFTFMPKFEIYVMGQYRGLIKKRFSITQKYDIEYNGWRCDGNFLGWDYDVYSQYGQVAHISKELFHWGDTYVIDIMNPSDELETMMLCIAIDAANCGN